MIIEYSDDDFSVEDTVRIDDAEHRIVCFSTGFYGLQSRDYDGEWRTWLVSPKQIVRDEFVSGDGDFLMGVESFMGKADLLSVLESFKSEFKLRNGEYWNFEVHLNGDESFNEVIKRSDGESLIKYVEDWHKFHFVDVANRGRDGFFNILMFFIVLVCIILVIFGIFYR